MKKINIFNLLLYLISIFIFIYFVYIIYKTIFTKRKLRFNQTKNFLNNDIDIVISWVANTPELQKEREYWLKKGRYENPSTERYTDHEEIKYLLRSIDKYFPNYRHIYIIVKDGQFPRYLKKNERLKIVNHSDVIPKEFLPTFNSRAIENYLHHIPNLSEYYIYANDDFIFTKEIDKSYYIDENGLPYVLLSDKKIDNSIAKSLNLEGNGFKCGIEYNSRLLDSVTKKEKRYEIPHCPMMYKKSFDFDIEKYFKTKYPEHDKINYYDKTGSSKFRRCDDLYLVSLLKPYLYKNWYNCQVKNNDSVIIDNYSKDIKITTTFICVEDITDNNFDKFKTFINKLFPVKSNYE